MVQTKTQVRQKKAAATPAAATPAAATPAAAAPAAAKENVKRKRGKPAIGKPRNYDLGNGVYRFSRTRMFHKKAVYRFIEKITPKKVSNYLSI